MIRGGEVADVYRATLRNEYGDPVDADGNVVRATSAGTSVGQVKGVVVGGMSASTSMRRQEASDTSGMLGVPVENTIKVQFGDRLIIDGVTYRITSRPLWTGRHGLTGTRPQYAWFDAEATYDG